MYQILMRYVIVYTISMLKNSFAKSLMFIALIDKLQVEHIGRKFSKVVLPP
jgi:hypothetical protein